MKRTISLKLELSDIQSHSLFRTQQAFSAGCNALVPYARKSRCWNRVALHHLSYHALREQIPQLGAQMVCNAIRKVCASYKVLKIRKSQDVPAITFRKNTSIHYCARTFTLKEALISLFTVDGRIKCGFKIGSHQKNYLEQGEIREGELIQKGKLWFFHLVLEIPDSIARQKGKCFAIDLGENNLATTSTGTIYGGKELRNNRDRFLARRRRLQSNGSRSAKRRLRTISGKERRHVKETNHCISKSIVKEAVSGDAAVIVMEDLTNIRKRIKGGRRLRSRLHRWAWHQLQTFVEYKAQAEGIEVIYINPAYTSLTCSRCGSMGSRHKHRFNCTSCGSYQHSDRNACQNLCKLAGSAVPAMASVDMPMVATLKR